MAFDVGTLVGRVEFEDKTSTTLDLIISKVDALEARFGSLHHGVVETAEGFVLGELAMKAFDKALEVSIELVKDFTTFGSRIGAVEQSFERLTAQSGLLGSTLMGTLREGTHGTITDFELMKSVNNTLTAGVKLTESQYTTLATGAFALARSKGLEVKDVFDDINTALSTGNARMARHIIGKVDLAAAEVNYALSLNKTRDQLSEAERLEADRIAILSKVKDRTAELGEQTDNLSNIVTQGHVAWANFYEDLIKTIGSSPHVIGMFVAIRDAVVNTFGGDTEGLVKTFAGGIDGIADTIAEVGPKIVHWLGDVRDWFVSLYHGAVDAWHAYGPVIVSGFTLIRDWLLNIYHAVIDTWTALPDWLKNVAEKSALTAAGLYVLGSAGKSAGDGVKEIALTISGLAQGMAALPTVFKDVAEGLASLRLLSGLTALSFTSFAAARISIGLLAGSIGTMIGPLGIAVVYSGLLYAAYELGKWQPISDFFQKWALVLSGHFTPAVAAAMVATSHATDAAAAQAAQMKEQNAAADAAKAVLDAMAKAQEEAAAAALKNTGAIKSETDALSASNFEKYVLSWEKLNALGQTYTEVLSALSPKLRDTVKYYAEQGVSVEDLKSAFPGLTDAQAQAAVSGKKAAEDIKNKWNETFGVIAKAHGDNINDFVKGENDKFKVTIENLRIEGKLTDEQYAAEKAGLKARVGAEIYSREQQSKTSRAYYQHDYEVAQAALDLAYQNLSQHSAQEIQLLTQTVREKRQILEHWAFYVGETLDAQAKSAKENAKKNTDATKEIGEGWKQVGKEIEHADSTVRELIVGVIKLKEITLRPVASFEFNANTPTGLAAMMPWLQRGYSDDEAGRLAALAAVSMDQANSYAALLDEMHKLQGKGSASSPSSAKTTVASTVGNLPPQTGAVLGVSGGGGVQGGPNRGLGPDYPVAGDLIYQMKQVLGDVTQPGGALSVDLLNKAIALLTSKGAGAFEDVHKLLQDWLSSPKAPEFEGRGRETFESLLRFLEQMMTPMATQVAQAKLPAGATTTPTTAVHFAPGSIVMNYPLVNDPKAVEGFMRLLNESLERKFGALAIRS